MIEAGQKTTSKLAYYATRHSYVAKVDSVDFVEEPRVQYL